MPKHSPKGPNPVDLHVGARVRMRRQLMEMSQAKLGQALGVTFQQVQKYEKGDNRIGASRLVAIATALGCGPEFFFDGAPGLRSPELVDQSKEMQYLALPGAVALLRAFARSTTKGQRSMLAIAEQVAA